MSAKSPASGAEQKKEQKRAQDGAIFLKQLEYARRFAEFVKDQEPPSFNELFSECMRLRFGFDQCFVFCADRMLRSTSAKVQNSCLNRAQQSCAGM